MKAGTTIDSAKARPDNFLSKHYPEIHAGGYTSVDGTVQFYSRINALLHEDMTVLDFGAGRGAWFEDDDCDYRKSLRNLRGKVSKIIACDLDPIVLENRAADEVFLCNIGERLELADNSIDIIISDYVFEHVSDPVWINSEFFRVLKPGGWICSRTPCKYSYVAFAARFVPNRLHKNVLKSAQPTRKALDVFPTQYKLNSLRAINRTFLKEHYSNWTYYFASEPAYHFNSSIVFRLLRLIAWIGPKQFHANLFIFLRKRVRQIAEVP